MVASVSLARSFLFVPASRPDRIPKALASDAGCVIVDLEDAVPPDQKERARNSLQDSLPKLSADQLSRTLVRINAFETPWFGEDLKTIEEWITRGLAGVMVPKAESRSVQVAGDKLGPTPRLVPLIESLAGLDALDVIGQIPQVSRIAFGHLDFQIDLGMRCSPDEVELAMVRFALVAASRRSQLPAPIDGVTLDIHCKEKLVSDSLRARAFGFGGKLCIHPNQVGPVNDTFAPSPEEIEWARRVLDSARTQGGEAFSLDGKMVDRPVICRAENILRARSD